MHVLWRRPDGFHGASPADFRVLEIAGQSRIWVHKTDCEWFPFKVSGGWQDEDATRRLNQFVNLINRPSADWMGHLIKLFHNSMADDAAKFLGETALWLNELKHNLKGDKWEMEIIALVIDEIGNSIESVKKQFAEAVKT